jgi:AcrR family transcriptional regulator
MPRIAADLRARRSETRRTQILEAAVRVFGRRGFDGATIKEIARSARLSEGSIYNYFRSKEDLLVHIPHHLIRPGLDPLLAPGAPPETLADVERGLRQIAQAIVERLQANAWFLKVFVSALPRLSPSARERYVSLLPMYAADVVERLLRDGMAAGVLRAGLEPSIASRSFAGMLVFFVVMQEVLLEKKILPHDYETIADEVVRLFLYGAAASLDPQRLRS